MTVSLKDGAVQLKRTPRLRLLPLVIFLATLTLGFRVIDVWQGVEVAAQEDVAEEGQENARAEDKDQQAAQAGDQVAETDPQAPEEGKARADQALDGEKSLSAVDPFSMTETEIELLQSLAGRRQELEQREKALEEKEALLKATETRVEEKIARLEEMQGRIEGLLGEFDDEEQQKLENLVQIYEKMKPKDAARIFEQLDMEVLLAVITRMKQRISAPILAEMRPDRAQQITVRMAEKRELPVLGE
ncbi:MotE family protein [Fodinicurvata halophila]|uniref:MotE family protein n=1 Tax=Fodinicurvata halophila TaxID=1419723 RepID=A0ABV8UK21_9PROT